MRCLSHRTRHIFTNKKERLHKSRSIINNNQSSSPAANLQFLQNRTQSYRGLTISVRGLTISVKRKVRISYAYLFLFILKGYLRSRHCLQLHSSTRLCLRNSLLSSAIEKAKFLPSEMYQTLRMTSRLHVSHEICVVICGEQASKMRAFSSASQLAARVWKSRSPGRGKATAPDSVIFVWLVDFLASTVLESVLELTQRPRPRPRHSFLVNFSRPLWVFSRALSRASLGRCRVKNRF